MTDPNKVLHLTWTEPEFPLEIEISVTALERLRAAAVEGLLAVPRIGLGIGGFLLGIKEETKLTVTDFLAISISHATGPSFHLTSPERELAIRMAQAKREKDVVGWYVTKARGPFEVDKDMYSDFCPAPWQITLLLRPGSAEKTTAVVAYRNARGELTFGAERQIDEWTLPFNTLVTAVDEGLSRQKPAREKPAPPLQPTGAEGFESVRSFGLVKPDPSRPPRKPALAQPLAPAETGQGSPEGPHGFQSILGVKLNNAPARVPRPDVPQDSQPEDSPAFEAIRTIHFMDKNAKVASPLQPGFESSPEIPAPDPKPELTHLQMPDGPIDFEPVRLFNMSGSKTPPSLVKPEPKSSAGQQTIPEDSKRFEPTRKSMFAEEPTRKSMFVEEPKYGPVRSVEAVNSAPLPPPPPKRSPFAEPLPERRPVDKPAGATPPGGFTSVNSVGFMSQAEKAEYGRHAEIDPEPEPVVVPVDPATAARRRMIFLGAGVIALAAATFFSRGLWLPEPLKIELTESNGHITALWNAETLSQGTTGSLTIRDGSQTTVTALSASKLAEGVVGFDRKSSPIVATLKAAGKTVTATLK